jgi:hypothetical protein
MTARLPGGRSRLFGCKCFPPGGQRREAFVPAKDFGELRDGKVHALGGWHQRPDGKIGDRELLANEPGFVS